MSKSVLYSFIKRCSLKRLIQLVFEDHLMFFCRPIPSYEGILFRRLMYKLIFKRLGKTSIIKPSVYMNHVFNISIGDYFGVNSNTHLEGRGGIEMGDHVMIGPNVFIGSSNHEIKASDDRPRTFQPCLLSRVKIGSHVWIGANSVVCPGVEIGSYSIVGAGSVVVHNVPDNVVVVGNPARIIKTIK
ncbi:acyltransferase [Candidatus Omnitrophota bacterium]